MTKYSELVFIFKGNDNNNKKCQECSSSMIDLGLVDVNIINDYIENNPIIKQNFKKIEKKDFINSIIKETKTSMAVHEAINKEIKNS